MKKAIILAAALLVGSAPLALAQTKGVSATTPGAKLDAKTDASNPVNPGSIKGASGFTPSEQKEAHPSAANGASSFAPGMANKKK